MVASTSPSSPTTLYPPSTTGSLTVCPLVLARGLNTSTPRVSPSTRASEGGHWLMFIRGQKAGPAGRAV